MATGTVERLLFVGLGLATSTACRDVGTGDSTADSRACDLCSDTIEADTTENPSCVGCLDSDVEDRTEEGTEDGVEEGATCRAAPAVGVCGLTAEMPWPVEAKLTDAQSNGVGSRARFGPNGVLCSGESDSDTAVSIICWGVGEANGVERSRRTAFIQASDIPQLVVDSRGHARFVWPSGGYDEQRIEYAVDDGPAEVIYQGDELGALYGLSIDARDRSVIAFSTGGTHGPNRLERAQFSLHIATRGLNGGWDVEDFAVTEQTGAGFVVASPDARWFVWTLSDGGYGVGPEYATHVVDLDGHAELVLPEGEPTLRTVRGGWVDERGGLNLLASVRPDSELAADLVHFTSTAQGWSRLDVQRSRDLPDGSDVMYGPTIVGDSLRLSVDAEGNVHAAYLEVDPSSGPISLVYATWNGDEWTTSPRDFYGIRLRDADLRALNAIYDVSAGYDGTVRVLMPATTASDPTRNVLMIVAGERCGSSCTAE